MRRQSLLLIAGLMLGLLGAAMVLGYVRSVENRAASSGEMMPVIVALDAIPAGTPASALEGRTKAASVPRAYAAPEAIGELGDVEGQFTTEEIAAGETLTARHFATAGSTRAGRLAIPKGLEAIAVAATLEGGLARYAAPGDRVSVYGTFREERVTRKILSAVEVLATQPNSEGLGGSIAGSSAPQTASLTYVLAVTPQEAAELVFATELGSVWFTLVPEGQESPRVRDVTMRGAR